ncbi:MAG TPA: hypothetical protein VFI66_00870 [Gemmatimonadales bacterium]|nr:hypothetical protein [Gemmatimonadales bacterium]
MVHHALETLRGNPRAAASSRILGLICAAALLAGCGASSLASTRTVTGRANTRPANVPTQGVGESLRMADCTNWRQGTPAQRMTTVEQLRRFSGGPIGSSTGIQRGPVLEDGLAYRLFDSYCAHHFARGFKLYKLYTHAAAMIGH